MARFKQKEIDMEELRRQWEKEKAYLTKALQRSERGARALKEQLAALQRQLEATTQKADARCRTLELEQAEKLGLAEAAREQAQRRAEVRSFRSKFRSNTPRVCTAHPHPYQRNAPTRISSARLQREAPGHRYAKPCTEGSRRRARQRRRRRGL